MRFGCAHCPKAAAFAELCYTQPAHLFFGNNRIASSTGAQQGDPLASLFFSLVLQPLIVRISEDCPDLLLKAFFLDDGIAVGKRADLQHLFDLLQTQGPEVGLYLNPQKSLVWCGGDNDLSADTDMGIISVKGKQDDSCLVG